LVKQTILGCSSLEEGNVYNAITLSSFCS